MPHDCNGTPIQAGDTVILRATVRDVTESKDACNATFDVIRPAIAEGEYAPTISCNAKLCEKREYMPAELDPNERMGRWFEYKHLPAHLQEVSKRFYAMACVLCQLIERGPERTVALRKLLEAKDAAVRAAIFPGG